MKLTPQPRPSTLAYLWVAPVTLFGLFLALIAYWLGASVKRRFGVLEVAGNTRTPILRSISSVMKPSRWVTSFWDATTAR